MTEKAEPMIKQLTAVSVLTIDNVSLYRLSGNARHIMFSKRPLIVLQYTDGNIYSLSMENFNYTLSKEIPVVRHGTELMYTFPDVDTYIGIELSANTPEQLVQNFEKILNENCYFITTKYNVILPESVQEDQRGGAAKVAGALTGGAGFIRSFFIKTAEVVSTGITKGSHFVSTRVLSKREKSPLKVGQKTQAVVHEARVTSEKFYIAKDKAVIHSNNFP